MLDALQGDPRLSAADRLRALADHMDMVGGGAGGGPQQQALMPAYAPGPHFDGRPQHGRERDMPRSQSGRSTQSGRDLGPRYDNQAYNNNNNNMDRGRSRPPVRDAAQPGPRGGLGSAGMRSGSQVAPGARGQPSPGPRGAGMLEPGRLKLSQAVYVQRQQLRWLVKTRVAQVRLCTARLAPFCQFMPASDSVLYWFRSEHLVVCSEHSALQRAHPS